MKLLERFREIGTLEDLALFLIRNSNVDQYLVNDLLNAGFKAREILETGLLQCLNTFEVNIESRRDLHGIFQFLIINEIPVTPRTIRRYAHLSKSARNGFGNQTINRFIHAYRDEIKKYHWEINYEDSKPLRKTSKQS